MITETMLEDWEGARCHVMLRNGDLISGKLLCYTTMGSGTAWISVETVEGRELRIPGQSVLWVEKA